MKKIILSALCCISMLSAAAQISATIVKKTFGQNIFICTTLTNNNVYPIHVIDGSMIGDDGSIESNGNTYIVFYSYDVNNNLLETSKKIPFTLSVPGVRKPSIIFQAGESCSSEKILFTTMGCVGILTKEINSNLKYIKAKVHVCYAGPDTDESFRELDIDLSQITL